MRPPRCAICGDRSAQTYRFADYVALPKGMTGHPRGLEYFCGLHSPSGYTHLPLGEAIKAIQESPGGPGPRKTPPPLA